MHDNYSFQIFQIVKIVVIIEAVKKKIEYSKYTSDKEVIFVNQIETEIKISEELEADTKVILWRCLGFLFLSMTASTSLPCGPPSRV